MSVLQRVVLTHFELEEHCFLLVELESGVPWYSNQVVYYLMKYYLDETNQIQKKLSWLQWWKKDGPVGAEWTQHFVQLKIWANHRFSPANFIIKIILLHENDNQMQQDLMSYRFRRCLRQHQELVLLTSYNWFFKYQLEFIKSSRRLENIWSDLQ